MVGAAPSQERSVLCYAQPCVQEIQKQVYEKKKIAPSRYDIFELEGEEKQTGGEGQLPHSEDPGQGHVVVFID
jgi:hypothetical protein